MNKQFNVLSLFISMSVFLLLLTAACTTEIEPTPQPTISKDETASPINTPSDDVEPQKPTFTVKPSPTEPPTIKACVAAHSLSVRSGPGTVYESVAYLSEGDCLTLLERSEDAAWARFKQGWVSTQYLELQSDSLADLMTGDDSSTNEDGEGSAASAGTLSSDVSSCIPDDTKRTQAGVYRVIDGDTIEVTIGEQVYDVRYIGVNAPETDQDFGGKATQKNRSILSSGEVTLVKDVSETDKYGRLLRYVISGGVFVNKELVEDGFAQASTYPPDVACSAVFREAQQAAQSNHFGVWGSLSESGGGSSDSCHPSYPSVCIDYPPPDLDCADISYTSFEVSGSDPHRFDGDGDGLGCEGASSSGSSSSTGGSGSGSTGSNCHPSYPGVCIPAPPPDLDCGQISQRNFSVTGSDPHRFDGDGDGVGCES